MTFTINIEIYDCRIHVLNSVNDHDFELYMFQHFKMLLKRISGQGTCWTITDTKGKEHYLLDLKIPMKKNPDCINLLVHEALHVTFAIAEKIKMPYTIDFDEPFCYLHGFIVQKLWEGIYEH